MNQINLTDVELIFMKLALNEAMDNTKNKDRYKMYDYLLTKLDK